MLGMEVFASEGGEMEGLAHQTQGTCPHAGQPPSPHPQTPQASIKGNFDPVHRVQILHMDLCKSEGPAGDVEVHCHNLVLNPLHCTLDLLGLSPSVFWERGMFLCLWHWT